MNEPTANERIEDRDIQEALRMSLVSEEPSESLLRNLRVMAKTAAPRRKSWSSSIAVAGAVAAGVVVASLTMLPSKATAKSFASLVKAAEQIRAFQFSIDSSEDGKHELLTIAGANGRFSLKTEEGTLMRIDANSLSFYDPKENMVTSIKLGGLVDAEAAAKQLQSGIDEGLKHMDLKKMLKDYEEKYGKDQIQISPVTREGGKDVYHVHMEARTEPSRVDMTVDAASDLPEQILVTERDKAGAQRQTLRMGMRYGSQVDASGLNASFPANAKKMELDLGNIVGAATKDAKALGSVMEQFGKGFKIEIK